MDLQLHRAAIDLAPRAFLTLSHARGVAVLCLAGDLWVTQDGDTRDHFVAAGEMLQIAVRGTVLIQAEIPSRVALLAAPPRPPGWRRFLAKWLGPASLDPERAPPAARLHAI